VEVHICLAGEPNPARNGGQWARHDRFVDAALPPWSSVFGTAIAAGDRPASKERVMRSQRLTTTGAVIAATVVAASPAVAVAMPANDAMSHAAGSRTTPRQDLRSPDARDAAERVPSVVVPVRVPERVAAPVQDQGIEWDSAAVGALAGAGVIITLAGGGVLLLRRRPRGARVA
jgi:hypothetical protein